MKAKTIAKQAGHSACCVHIAPVSLVSRGNARVEEWFDVLATCWKFESSRRLHAVCSILVRNDFMDWPQLQYASDPSEWEIIAVLTFDELAFLRDFIRQGKQEPKRMVEFVHRSLWFAYGLRSPRTAGVVEPTRSVNANMFHDITEKRAVCETANGVGPAAALKRLKLEDRTPGERCAWIETARLDAILGGMRLPLPSLRTGLRCYVAFVSTRGVRGLIPSAVYCMVRSSGACFPESVVFFPPSLTMLLAWTTMFRSGGTLRNYLGYVKTGCIIAGVSTGASCESTGPARCLSPVRVAGV